MITRSSKSFVVVLSMMLAMVSASGQQLQARPRYLLRPGDTLQLVYHLTPDLNQTILVQPDGYVGLNIAGEVHIAGMSVDQAHDLIVSKVSTQLNAPELDLILKDFTHPYIVVAGEVLKPGQIDVKDNMTALSAILMAGGFTQSAKSGQVLVFRRVNDQIAEVKQLNFTYVNKTAKLEHDLPLEPGDMILVPHDRISRLEHFMQAANVGLYLNPFSFIP